MRNKSIVQLLSHERRRLLGRHFSTLNFSLELKHFEERGIQTILCVHVKEAGIIEVQHFVFLFEFGLVFLFLALTLEAIPLLLAGVHCLHQGLNLRGCMIFGVDSTASFFHFLGRQFACWLHTLYSFVFFKTMEQTATKWTEWLVHRVLFWETDDAKKGRILRGIHHAGVFALGTLIVVSHTLYPALWLQTILLAFCLLVWAQHVLTNGCLLSKVEQKLIGDETSFLDPFLELFHIEATEQSKRGILILGSTVVVGMLSMEWVARVIHKLVPLVAAQVRASVAAARIPLPSSSL